MDISQELEPFESRTTDTEGIFALTATDGWTTDRQIDRQTNGSVVRLDRLKIIAKYSKNYDKLQNAKKNKTVSA